MCSTDHALVGYGDVIGLLRLEHLPLIGALAPVVLACAWAGRRLAAPPPQRVFEPLVIAATVPPLVS